MTKENLLGVKITGNVDDRDAVPELARSFLNSFDRGFTQPPLEQQLGAQLFDKLLLRKRSIIETCPN